MEINPAHSAIKTLLDKVEEDPEDPEAKQLMETLFETAKIKSGFMLRNPVEYADKVEEMIFKVYNIPNDVPFDDYDNDESQENEPKFEPDSDSDSESDKEHDEL